MRSALAIALFSVLLISPLNAETVIGRWCDKAIPNMPKWYLIHTILISDDGIPMHRLNAGDGSSTESVLLELGNETYAEQGDQHGDKYRIVPSTGQLQLLDNDGLIRTASRLENSPQQGECQ